MKKFLVMFLAVMMLCSLTLSGCGGRDSADAKGKDDGMLSGSSTSTQSTSKSADDDDSKAQDADESESGTKEADENGSGETGSGEDEEDALTASAVKTVDKRTDIQKYWNGDWYGWLSVLATGDYEEFNEGKYDACGRIEVDENGDGTLTLWYGYEDGDTYDSPTGVIDIHIDDTIGEGSHGTLISTGGWMFVRDFQEGKVDEGEIYVKPDEKTSIDCVYINYEYKDEYGSIKPLFALRPWGYTWQDDMYYEKMDNVMPAFFEWYTALIEEGWAQPDDFTSTPSKTMKERKEELIELAANQNTPERNDTDEYNEFMVQLDDFDFASNTSGDDWNSDDNSNSGSYYNDSTDFENELGSSRITHGFEKEFPKPTVTGKKYTWGNLAVNIPDGMEAKNGGLADADNKNSLQILKGTKYFIVSQRYELDALDDVTTTIEMNDADEVAVTVGETVWEGGYYEYSGSPIWQVYANIGDACIEIMCYGFDFDSAEAQTVLSTVKSTKLLWED